ncbi:MAG TPA: chemotaxis protein CheB [Pirellulales bacterium]|nr:chemotaxis protein CheB [Pirellulales bacterium]
MYEIVVIGTSLGGLNALRTILGALPKTFSLPIVIAQHRSADVGDGLAEYLSGGSSLAVVEPSDKQPILPGSAYLAPADYHLLIEPRFFTLSTEAPVQFARPSIDALFESAADSYGSHVVGVVLTGASADGAKGAAAILQKGGLVVVQEPTTAESPTMPESAIEQGGCCVRPLAGIATFLTGLSPPSSTGGQS